MMLNFGSSSDFGMNHSPWKDDEKKINKFCFIGKNLNKDEITDNIKKCLFDGKIPEPGPIPETKLRFKVGDRVKCKRDEWEEGFVIKLWYREDLWETGRYAPYQVLLENRSLIWVPRDTNVFIKESQVKNASSNNTLSLG